MLPKSLTACVCTYQRYDILGDCLDALLKQSTVNTDYSILVVDNSPNESDAKAFRQRFKGSPIKFLWTSTPGLSNARNIGAQQCGTEIIAYVDDAICDEHWAVSCYMLSRTRSQCGVVGGRSIPFGTVDSPIGFPLNKLDYFQSLILGIK